MRKPGITTAVPIHIYVRIATQKIRALARDQPVMLTLPIIEMTKATQRKVLRFLKIFNKS